MGGQPIILVVDDEIRSVESLRRVLGDAFEVLTATSAAEAESFLEGETVHAILCDQRMPGLSGVEFLKRVRDRWPDPVRIIISGYTDAEDIIAGINDAGIYRYVTKPWDPEDLTEIVRGAVQLFDLQQENHSASLEMKVAAEPLKTIVNRKKSELKRRFGFESIVHTEGSPMEPLLDLADKIAGYDISVLITGESGTGKELLARAIHYASGRADKPFVVENCGALPDQLLESELFGCKKGAFTGAYEDRIGLFEQASGGTIFLDEIGETSPAFQVKLLRVLQEGEIRPLGGQRRRKVDVRVIAATNRDLEAEVDSGTFRQDLYYRLAGMPIHMPPLRDRHEDLPHLARMLLHQAARTMGKPVRGLTDTAMAKLRTHHWPGNVRELQNEIQRMVALGEEDGWLDENLLSAGVIGRETAARVPASGGGTLKQRVEALETAVIAETMAQTAGNISRAADLLGLSRVGLRSKLKRYGLAFDGDDAPEDDPADDR